MNPTITKRLGYLCLGAMSLYGVQAYAQTMNDIIHSTYAEFDSTQLSTHFLLNRSMNVTNLENTAVEIDSTANTTRNWLQSYMDLRSGQYANALPLSPETLFQFMDEYDQNELNPIGLIAKKTNSIPESAFEDGSIGYDTVSSQLDFSNFNYALNEQLVVVAGPMVPLVYGETMNLIFEQDFLFSDVPIDSLVISIPAIDHVQKISFNTVYPISLVNLNSETGTFTVYVHFYSNSRLYRRGMEFKRLLPIDQPDEIVKDFSVPNACSFNPPKGFGEARVYVLYSSINKFINRTITKPLVLVEGYDPSTRKYGSIRWRTFNTGKSYNEFGEPVYQQLALMPELITELTGLDYDILIVDFKTSSLPIETNAATLASIIQWAKHITQGDADVTLMAASMGGLVSQTAMNLLDQSGCKTCVGTFVSFDAPYHGANVSMGVQVAAKFFYENFLEARIQYLNKLNVPAAKQMLYDHVNGNAERLAWMNTFGRMNKKLADFNICLTSSSDNSLMNGIQDGSEILYWEIYSSVNLKKYVDLHMYAPKRFNGMVFQAKMPLTKNLINTPKTFIEQKSYFNSLNVNYDGMPGSQSDFLGEMFDQIVKANNEISAPSIQRNGPSVPLGRQHTFIPTVSAIDFTSKDPLTTLVNYKFNQPTKETPFDRIYFPKSNNLHVLISFEQIDNVKSALGEGLSQNKEFSGLNPTNAAVYNCAKTIFSTFKDIHVVGGTEFRFNDYERINYGLPGVDPYTSNPETYARTSNCGAYVNCEANGSIILGGTSPNNEQYQAEVLFRKGSVLELQSDAVLRIRDASTLIIDEGALMIIHPGAQIILEGENAVLELRGTVRLESGATFTFTKGTASKGGFVRFNYKDNSFNHFEPGLSCKINLTGETHFKDKIAEIVENTSLSFINGISPNWFQLDEFKLKDGLVEYTGNGRIDAECPINFQNVDFEQTGSQAGTGLITHGQTSITLEDCVFKNFSHGLIAFNNDLGSDLMIKNNIFSMCANGLESYGRKLTLDKNGFHTCGTGVSINGTTDVVMQGTAFLYNSAGIQTSGSNIHVRVDEGWFYRNDYGISDNFETKITLSCSPFEYNAVAVYTNGKVSISPNYIFPGQTYGGANNTFNRNQTSFLLDLSEIHLVNGQNNFIAGSTSQIPNFLSGSLVSNPTYIPNKILDVSGNYFDNIPSGGISTGHGTLYDLYGFGATVGQVLLNGSLLNSFNQTCYFAERIFPDFKGEVRIDAEEYDHRGTSRLDELKVYPNPTDDLITLEGKTEANSKRAVILYDLNGKEIHRRDWILVPGLNRTQIALQELVKPGVYLIKIIDDSGDYQVVRISLTY